MAGTAPNYVSTVECTTGSDGIVKATFRVTMQPGDNFAIAASMDGAYRSGLKVNSSDGSRVVNAASEPIHISGQSKSSSIAGIRTKMLTVWRKLHLEVDSMGNIGAGNNVVGTITAVDEYSDPNCVPPIPDPPPCYSPLVGYDVTTLDGTPLEVERFENGRIKIGSKSFDVFGNITNRIFLKGVPTGSGDGVVGQSFTLYDDDDYNADDSLLDGDNNEQIVRLPDSFKYLSAEDGNYSDGKPKNLLAGAYIMPEYQWAENLGYNQINLPFVPNVSLGVNNLDQLLNANRESKNSEKDGFWIGYLLIAYQADMSEDADGVVFNIQTGTYDPEPGASGIGRAPAVGCDCYQSGTCIGNSCNSLIPRGAFGSLIFEEVMQDVTRSWLRDGGLVIKNLGTTAPHELGHQFGLDGDNRDPATGQTTPGRSVATYRIMDYPHRLNDETDDYGFHPEHINIMRKRVASPGE